MNDFSQCYRVLRIGMNQTVLRTGQRWYIWARDEAFPARFDSASVFVRRRHQLYV